MFCLLTGEPMVNLRPAGNASGAESAPGSDGRPQAAGFNEMKLDCFLIAFASRCDAYMALSGLLCQWRRKA
jgi:hypothetical protein